VSECGQASDLGEIVNECGLQRTERLSDAEMKVLMKPSDMSSYI
jgi:hypothetical protein